MIFLITEIGNEKIKEIYSNKNKFLLKLELSDHYQAINTQRTKLSHTILTITPAVLKSRVSDTVNLHLQAYIKKNAQEIAIYEIGLLIAETTKTAEFTLFAISGEENPVLTISSKSDLLLDFFIHLNPDSFAHFNLEETDEPKPIVPYAEETTYGLVRFATIAEIKKKAKNLALSTQHLDFLDKKTDPNGILSKALSAAYPIQLTPEYREIVSQGVCSLASTIYQINIVKHNTLKSMQALLFEYDFKTNQIKRSSKTIACKPDKINAYLRFNSSQLECIFLSEGMLCRLNLQDNNKNDLEESKAFLPKGQLALYSNYLLTAKSQSKDLALINLETMFMPKILTKTILIKNFLDYPRKAPFIYIVQDKIYCLGVNGNQPAVPFVEICTLDLKQLSELETTNKSVDNVITCENTSRSFVANSVSPIPTHQAAELISCLQGSWIYLFIPNHYYQLDTEQTIYRYHTLSHQWETLIPADKIAIEDNNGGSKHSSVVATPNGIYLFLTHEQEKSGQFEMNVLKYLPPP